MRSIYSTDAAQNLSGSFLSNRAGKSVEQWHELTVPESIVLDRIGDYVHTGYDWVDVVSDVPLVERLQKAVSAGLPLDDEQIMNMIGFKRTSLSTHYTDKAIVGAGVGSKHTIVQVEEMVDWVVSVCGTDSIVSASLFDGGSTVMIIAKAPVDDLPTLPGVTMGYLAFVESFNRTYTSSIVPLNFIPKCSNVLPALVGKGIMSHRHSQTTVERGSKWCNEMVVAHAVWKEAADFITDMASVQCDVMRLLDKVAPRLESDDKGFSRRETTREEILFAYGSMVAPEHKGTLFGAHMAVDSYRQWPSTVRKGVELADRQVSDFMSSASGSLVRKDLRNLSRQFVAVEMGRKCLI